MGHKIRCPRCGTKADYEGNPYRPFCSERCKLIDLGNWITGTYRVPTKDDDEQEDETGLTQSPPEEEES